MWSENRKKIPEAFDRLQLIIRQSIENGIRVILCMQEMRSHHFATHFGNRDMTPLNTMAPLFKSGEEVAKFRDLWLDLSESFGDVSASSLAYELLNEPLSPSDAEWNRILGVIYKSVREKEPHRTVVFGSNYFQYPEKIRRLSIPKGDRNIIRSFHFYHPNLLTHHKATWGSIGKYKGPVKYPGRPIPDEYESELAEQGINPKRENIMITKSVMKMILKNAIGQGNVAKTPIHCGEFGCYEKLSMEMKIAWHEDIVSCFEELGIAWSQWDWKGNFGLLNRYSWRPAGIHKAMGLKSPVWGYPRKRSQGLLRRVRSRITRSVQSIRDRIIGLDC